MKFSESHPHTANLFHPTKNGTLEFDSLSRGMRKKIWWLCPHGHEYESYVYQISKLDTTTGCPYCAGKRVDSKKSLMAVNPKLAAEWDNQKNEKTPCEYMPNSKKKVWWICPDGHSFLASIANRNSLSRGCNVCSGHVIDNTNSLLAKYPAVAAELHPTKNQGNDPSKISCSQKESVWWLCSHCEHEWRAMPHNRARKRGATGCPACTNKVITDSNNLRSMYPDLAKQWHPTKNGNLSDDEIVPGSNKRVWWLCSNGHTWRTAPVNRIKKDKITGCPKCSRQTSTLDLRIFTELVALYPDTKLRHKIDHIECDVFIAELKVAVEFDGSYWHKEKANKDKAKTDKLKSSGIQVVRLRQHPLKKLSPDDIVVSGNEILKKHIDRILECIGENRLNESAQNYLESSSFCNEKLFKEWISYLPDPHPSESIQGEYPHAVPYWDFKKNYPVTPSNIRPSSEIKFWWLCPACQHSWEQDPYHVCKRKKKVCSKCSEQQASDKYNFAVIAPYAALEWHPQKNGDFHPEEFTPKTAKKFWFLCKKGHEFEASLANRTAGKGCPYCVGRKVSRENSLACKAPAVAALWDYSSNGDLTPWDLTAGSDKTISWSCTKMHSWKAKVYKMVKIRTIHCPKCRKEPR